jgi:hypothetical protein
VLLLVYLLIDGSAMTEKKAAGRLICGSIIGEDSAKCKRCIKLQVDLNPEVSI